MSVPFSKQLQIFVPFALGYFLSYLYRTINAVLAPDLARDVGVDPSDLGLLTAAYLITFAAAQLPLGMLLDRYGPRRIEAALLLLAAGGAIVFSQAQTLTGLTVGRGLIGLGVSACLMAAFKAFVTWFPKEQLPLVNGIHMASGGLGALVATTPVQAALALTDWRGVFLTLGLITLAVAGIIFWGVPDREASPESSRETWQQQMAGIRRVFTSLTFWRIAPWATISQGSFMAIYGLWAGPWLRDVAGLDRTHTAATLSWVAVAMIAGWVSTGWLAERLARRGIATIHVAVSGMGLSALTLALIVLGTTLWPQLLWALFGFLGTTGILTYSVLSQKFPVDLAGRANTALNLLVFVAAFGIQWGIGALIELWPVSAQGNYAPQGYQAAFGVTLALQVAGILWYALSHVWRSSGARDQLA